ncbi:hypothetical protein E2C01_075040 [Portunus trituberculatus]|uniref:Uncharacterized protein n=1 Tax=Portunus trituberculatus TaxID=210409 RepID=A0A5B7I7F8_PORTR|nr:hypothetical protein [Portunus trituberculatus]
MVLSSQTPAKPVRRGASLTASFGHQEALCLD